MTQPARIGLIGAGLIGQKHAQYLAASPDCVLAAIADPSPGAETVAAAYGVSLYAGFEAMLSNEKLDGVIIAAPNDLHEAAGVAAASAGVPMLIEKPIAADRDAAARLTEAAKKAGVPALVGHHRRYNVHARQVKKILGEGGLGRLVAVNSLWCVRKPEPYFEAAWRTRPGGGPVLINLIHEIDLLRFIVGEIVEVQALGSNAVRGFEVEDSVALCLRFANGALGTVLLSDTAPSPWSWEQASGENHPTFPKNQQNPTRFFGTEAALEFPSLKLWRHDGPANWNFSLTSEDISLTEVDVYAEQIAHFVRVIRGQEEPIITAEDASRSLATTLAVLDAIQSKKTISLV